MAKLKINVDSVLGSLSQVVGVVNTKNPIPILGDIVFHTSTAGLTVTASDGETWLSIVVPCIEFDEPTKFCVIAADIYKVLSNLKGKDVEMVLDEETHTLKCTYGNGHFELPYEKSDDYPRPSMDMSDAITKEINAANIQRAIEKTTFAVANDRLRPIMNGIHFDFFEYGMVAVATDTQKMAKFTDKTTKSDGLDAFKGFTLPKKPCTILQGILNGCDTNIDVTFNDKCAMFKNDVFAMRTRLLEGNYPNYELVMPKDNNIITTVNKSEFMEALRRVMPMGNATSSLVKLLFEMGKVTIFAEDAGYSKSADESVECDYATQAMSIGFNGNYLLETLQAIDGDDFKICLKEKVRPGVFTPINDDENEEYISLLMPIFI